MFINGVLSQIKRVQPLPNVNLVDQEHHDSHDNRRHLPRQHHPRSYHPHHTSHEHHEKEYNEKRVLGSFIGKVNGEISREEKILAILDRLLERSMDR